MLNRITRDHAHRLVSADTAARHLGVDVDTLVRWHRSNRGPAAATAGYELRYRTRDLEAWQEQLGARPA